MSAPGAVLSAEEPENLENLAVTAGRIPEDALRDNRSVKTVQLMDGVTSIGDYAFYKSVIEDIALSETVLSIGNGAFSGASLLESIVIPLSVEYMGGSVFTSMNSGLAHIYCRAESKPSGWDSSWKDSCKASVTWGYGR